MGLATVHAVTDWQRQERANLCLPSAEPGVALHARDPGFGSLLRHQYSAPESVAAEQLMRLKAEIRDADTDTFWLRLLEGMTNIAHAQYGFVTRRVEVDDDHGISVELPPLGEEGSCLRCVALYCNDGLTRPRLHLDYKYHAWGSPCSYMKHDKVFLIPERMSEFITINQTSLPFAADAYLAVPLFVRGKCFAHFGMMWTQDGLDARGLSWANTEMMLHSLEDLVTDRLLSGYMPQLTPEPKPNITSPQEAAITTPSLEPFAKSLSHELRTPMHGVVGMLDVMYATVQEQIEASPNPSSIRHVFESLRDDIEMIQVSCKRAVEAADNVVHASDMNLQIPDTPLREMESPALAAPQSSTSAYFDCQPSRLIDGNNAYHPHKRRRTITDHTWYLGNPPKIRHLHSTSSRRGLSPLNKSPIPSRSSPRATPPRFDSSIRTPESLSPPLEGVPSTDTDTLKYCSIRELIPAIIQESLQVGDRPDSAISEPTDLGERIEVQSRSANGDLCRKTIEWSVVTEVPEIICVEERDISKLISAVILNAVKFTETGTIRLAVNLTSSKKSLVIDCLDTGFGIPEDFRPQLFKPFSREDDSITRSREGLGLGLLVAKGLSRRLGGDLTLVRSEVDGPQRGSHFEIRVPLEPAQATASLHWTPTLSHAFATSALVSSPSKTDGSQQHFSYRHDPSPPPEPLISGHQQHTLTPVVTKPAGLMTTLDPSYDRKLADKYPLTILIAEDNKINRKILVSMLGKLGYKDIHEAFDGREAVRIMRELYHQRKRRPTSPTAPWTGPRASACKAS
ncbi:hypothetical protein DV738_g3489, partial [Chaetothyriales sp. CBS 135597]